MAPGLFKDAVPLMQAIEGDGSPWSYLSASILSREAAEFGAMWHGCDWSDQTILSKPRGKPTTSMCRTTRGARATGLSYTDRSCSRVGCRG